MGKRARAMVPSLVVTAGLAWPAEAIILAEGEVTYDFLPVSGSVSPGRTPEDVRVGRMERGRLTVDGGSRLRMDSRGDVDPFLVVARRAGSGGSEVVIDNGAIDVTGSDRPGGLSVQVGRESFGRMTIRNGGELNLANPDLGNPDPSGAGLSVGRSSGGGELLIDGGSVTIDSEDSAFVVGREGGRGDVTLRNGSTLSVLDDGPIDPNAGGNITVGRSGMSNGTLAIEDSEATIRSNTVARLFVGRDLASGRLDVSGGASEVTIEGPDSRLVVGDDAGATGVARIDNAARVTITGDDATLEIARSGGAEGRVVIAGGAVVDVTGGDGDARVAADLTGFGSANDGGTGWLEVAGAGTRLNVQDTVIAGSPDSFGGSGAPRAEIIVANGGSITADEVIIGRGASLSGAGGEVVATVVNDGGQVAPGLSPGVLTVDVFNQTIGTLEIEIAGLAPGQFDVLNVRDEAIFSGGSILFAFIDGFLPSAGDVIPFLTAAGGFELANTALELSGVQPGFDFSLLDTGGGLSLLANSDALAVAEPPALSSLLLGMIGLGLLAALRRRDGNDAACAVIECARRPG